MHGKHAQLRQDLLTHLLRFAHWDPQTYGSHGRDFADPLVSKLIDQLDVGDRASSLRTLRRASSQISDKFNELGYWKSVFSAQPLKPEEVEEFLRDHLSNHFDMPPKLGLV